MMTFTTRFMAAGLAFGWLVLGWMLAPTASAQIVFRSNSDTGYTLSSPARGTSRPPGDAWRYDPRLLPPSGSTTVRRVVYDAPAGRYEPADLPPRLNGGPTVTRSEFVTPGCGPPSALYYGSAYGPLNYGGSGEVPPPSNAYRPLLPLTGPPSRYYVGQGLIGQPKVFVPNQPVRNFFRYVLP